MDIFKLAIILIAIAFCIGLMRKDAGKGQFMARIASAHNAQRKFRVRFIADDVILEERVVSDDELDTLTPQMNQTFNLARQHGITVVGEVTKEEILGKRGRRLSIPISILGQSEILEIEIVRI